VPLLNRSVEDLWVNSQGKRVLDFTLAAICLIVSAPLLAICAVLIRFTSPGPVLFRQKRVGRNGHLFEVFKLRTMRVGESAAGPKVTHAGDQRITPLGRFLRAHKIDELPQLINVLRGEMSLVGPRPLVPEQATHVFSCRPGLTGAGSLAFRNQEQILHLVAPEHLTRVHPEVLTKCRIEAECGYLLKSNAWSDINVIWESALAVGGLKKRTSYDLDVRAMIASWASSADRTSTTHWFKPEYSEAVVKPRVRAAGV
jgi:lipopolysaccharide/colanic/teichoic acid biosynthesis glycosyltransferase